MNGEMGGDFRFRGDYSDSVMAANPTGSPEALNRSQKAESGGAKASASGRRTQDGDMGRGASEINGIGLGEITTATSEQRLFQRRHYECVAPEGTVFADPQDREIYELRVTGLALFQALLDKVPVPTAEEVKTRAVEGRKIAIDYEAAWATRIRKTLASGNGRYPRFEFEGETVNIFLPPQDRSRDLFDIVLWYRDTPYTGNFKATGAEQYDNVFGSNGFAYILSGPEMKKAPYWDVALSPLPKEKELALMVNRWRSNGSELPTPREYFLVSYSRKTLEARVVPLTAMTSGLTAPSHNTLQAKVHDASFEVLRPWAESWHAMADLIAAHAAKRAHLHNLYAYGEPKLCVKCAEERFGNWCLLCGEPLSELPESFKEAQRVEAQLELACETGF